ncbi:MAG: ACT domain-containing protein [Alphaproteobacteria bacterium]|nr:ACT domain-containing protein [Alphaproteobacteria bacterium]
MKIVVTIIGQDRIGIVAKISTALAEAEVNIMDINQNIMNGFFNMVMIADMQRATLPLDALQKKLADVGRALGVDVKIQHEDIFNAMHRI